MARKNRNRNKPASTKPIAPNHHAVVRSVEVDNPYFQREHNESSSNAKRSNADINIKESAIETLFARKFLARSQKQAADKFRELWEAAGGKTASLDYTLDRVDGGKGDPVVGRLIAAQELVRVRNLVGRRGFEVLEDVCCMGKGLPELTPHKRERLTMADNLRADLDDAASMWGLQTRRRSAA
jgi:hypothetical protein